MKKFELFEPESLEEASTLAVKWGENAVIHAGGTDVIVAIKNGKLNPEAVISLRKVPDLTEIIEDGDVLRLGACTTIRAIEKSAFIREHFPALADAVDAFGSIQVRNIATIGGNICTGLPSADTVCPLLVYDARIAIHSGSRPRTLPLSELLVGPGKTALIHGEILKQIILPLPAKGTEGVYSKLTRRSAMELALVGAATRITFDPDGTILNGSIALSCAGPVCFRARRAESLLPGKKIDDTLANEVGNTALLESSPRDSDRCTRTYREKMIPVLIARNLRSCLENRSEGRGSRQRPSH